MATAHVHVTNEIEEMLQAQEVPAVDLPKVPRAGMLWSRALTLASIVVTLFTIDRLTVLFGDYWLLNSLGLDDVFWTNFNEGARLYVAGFAVFAFAIAAPAFFHDVGRSARKVFTNIAILIGSVAAYMLAMKYLEFLLGGVGLTFGQTDPVFGND